MLGVFMLAILAMLVSGVTAVVIIVAAVVIHWGLGVLFGLMLIPITFAVIWLVTTMVALTERIIVIRNACISDALAEAYQLIRTNLKETVIIFLINLGFSIAFAIAAMIIWIMVGLPIAALGLSVGAGLIPTLLIVLLAGAPVSLVVGGFTGTVTFNLYTLFYFELVEPGQTGGAPVAAPGTV